MSQHIVQTLATPSCYMFCLLDMGYVFFDHCFSQHVEVFEDAFVWEMLVTVAVATVLLDGLLLGTFLGDMSHFMTIVAEATMPSASK